MDLLITGIVTLLLACNISIVSAATIAAIDPSASGAHLAAFVHHPSLQAGSEQINFGSFSNFPSDDITISGGSFHGFAWSPVAGWIVMNCADTASGCSSNNQNFKVSIDATGVVSGYAWGQQTGWINFGPFVNNTTPQIKIDQQGNFAGTTGTAGYAWSQAYGWIVFDCGTASTCVTSNYGDTHTTDQATTATQSVSGSVSSNTAVPVPTVSTTTSVPTSDTAVIVQTIKQSLSPQPVLPPSRQSPSKKPTDAEKIATLPPVVLHTTPPPRRIAVLVHSVKTFFAPVFRSIGYLFIRYRI